MMHILVLPSWYPSEDDPINGSFFAEQAEALADFGHRVSVIALFGDAHGGIRIVKKQRGRAEEYELHYKPLPFHLTYFRIMTAISKLLSGWTSADRPDIIHVHSFRAIRYARAISLMLQIPYIVTEHVSWFERDLLSERDLRSVSAGYARASAVIAVSEGLRDQISALSRLPVRVVPNLVDERFFRTELTRPPGQGFRFLSIGSLNRNKGMDVLLSAFSAARKVREDLTLTICGDGEERERLERLSVNLGVTGDVRFTGQVSREQCARYLTECDAFILASRVETFGIVLAEAMACGRPVIMTKTGVWRRIVSPDTGLAVEPDDISGLSHAMLTVAGDPGRYDPVTIREFCRARFSAQAVCESLTDIYEEVLGIQ